MSEISLCCVSIHLASMCLGSWLLTCPENTVHVENRVRFIIGLELRLELASKMISGKLKYLQDVELL